MQIKSVESILANEKAKIILNNALFNLNIQEDVLKNPANSNLTLDAKLSENNERAKQLEFYLKNKNLRINPTKNSELMTKVFSSEKALDESELNDLLEENFFLPNDMTYQELEKLTTLPEAERKLIYEAFEKLKQSPEYQNIKLEALANGKIKILSNGNESTIEPVTRTLEGLKNRFGEIPFASQEELIRTALLVNAIRMHEHIWGESPDHLRTNDENWPFDIGNSLTKSIYFKKNGGDEEVIISDLLPVVSNMDWNFPTLEARENRIFFAKYLNELWKNDPNTNKGTPPQSANPQTPQKK